MVVGLLLGVVIGLLIGPLFRSWLAWREFTAASREAALHEEVIRLLSEPHPTDESREGPLGPVPSR